MRKMLLASVFALVPFIAFAGQDRGGFIAAGDANIASTQAGSTAGVSSVQGTGVQTKAAGNGAVLIGAVSGNYTRINTGAAAGAGPKGSYTNTTAAQTNIGDTVAGGLAANKPQDEHRGNDFRTRGDGAFGSAGGFQTSADMGGSTAKASNLNMGGFVAIQPAPEHGKPGRGH
jgi:hypothetical protein